MDAKTIDQDIIAINVELKIGLSKIGRPNKISSETLLSLITCFRNGLDRNEACQQAQIGRTTFYRYMEKSETFRNIIERSEDYPSICARTAIVKSITGNPPNLESAKWWLEHFMPEKYNLKYINRVEKVENRQVKEESMRRLGELARKYANKK